MCDGAEVLRNMADKLLFSLEWIPGIGGQANPGSHPENMCVNGDDRLFMDHGCQDIGGFPADTRYLLQFPDL